MQRNILLMFVVLAALLVTASCSIDPVEEPAQAATGNSGPVIEIQAAYGWSRVLITGMSGADVKELQIRIAGWAAGGASQSYVIIDGIFGAGTEAAVKRFQTAYGLTVDGIAGSQTVSKLNSPDGSTIHFNWSEFYSKDGSGFSDGNVSSSVIMLMWAAKGTVSTPMA